MTVRQLLAHQAGLSALDIRLDPAAIADWEGLNAALARQRPFWQPGQHHGYHYLTLGWYESELLRRVDPRGRRLPAFFADEIARPLAVDFEIGLPADRDPGGVANVVGWPAWRMLFHLRALPSGMVPGSLNQRSITAFGNPRLSNPADLDKPEYRSLEIPAGVGFGSARAIATIYGELATGGSRLGLGAETFEAITGEPQPPPSGSRDLVLRVPTSYAYGWWRPVASFSFGSPSAFGTPGAGGSFGFADPARAIGYGYVTNRMGYHVCDDPRDLALRRALDRRLA